MNRPGARKKMVRDAARPPPFGRGATEFPRRVPRACLVRGRPLWGGQVDVRVVFVAVIYRRVIPLVSTVFCPTRAHKSHYSATPPCGSPHTRMTVYPYRRARGENRAGSRVLSGFGQGNHIPKPRSLMGIGGFSCTVALCFART